MKSKLLKAKRVENGVTQKNISKILDIDSSSYSKKENGILEFKVSEIKLIRKLLKLSSKDILEIFFDENLTTNS